MKRNRQSAKDDKIEMTGYFSLPFNPDIISTYFMEPMPGDFGMSIAIKKEAEKNT